MEPLKNSSLSRLTGAMIVPCRAAHHQPALVSQMGLYLAPAFSKLAHLPDAILAANTPAILRSILILAARALTIQQHGGHKRIPPLVQEPHSRVIILVQIIIHGRLQMGAHRHVDVQSVLIRRKILEKIFNLKFLILLVLTLFLASPQNSHAQTWQKVSPSVGGGGTSGGAAYTAWGTTSCATGYTVAYSGEAIFPMSTRSNEGTALGSAICSATSLTLDTQQINSAEPFWANGTEPDGTNFLQRTIVDCAKCVK